MSGPLSAQQLLERLDSGQLPEAARRAAAQGALPLPPSDLIQLQVALATRDVNSEIREAAGTSLASRDPDVTSQLLASEDLSPEVARYFAHLGDGESRWREVLIDNPACPGEALADIAARAEGVLVDQLLLNQVRLIESAGLLRALEGNPILTAGQRVRLAEIRFHFLEQPQPQAPPGEPLPDPDLVEKITSTIQEADGTERRAPESELPDDEVEHVDGGSEQSKTTFHRILDLGVAERVKLAFLGSGEERSILIRDSNRIIAFAVLKSPRITDKDVEKYVKMRSLKEELLQVIAGKREWMRNYQVVLGLVRHPKTPPRITGNLMLRVNDRDLKLLSTDRNIPEVVRQNVRRTILARSMRKGGVRS